MRESFPSDVGLMREGATSTTAVPSGRRTTYPAVTLGMPVGFSFVAP